MKKTVLSVAVASMFLLGGCGLNEKVDNSKPVIKVNDSVITQKMIDSSIQKESTILGGINKNKEEDKFLYLVYKNKAVNDLIIKELLRQETDKRKITVSEEEIDAKIEEIIEKVGGKAKFDSYFASNKIDKKDFREKIKFDIINEKLVKALSGKETVNEKAVKEFYEKNKAKFFTHPEQVKASHILISASEPMIRAKIENKTLSAEEVDKKVKEELDKAKVKAEKVLAKIKANPEKFEATAKKESEDPSSAKKGGDLGFFSKDKMVPSFSKVAFETKPGEISELVKTEYGYHIIKVVDRKQAGTVPFDEVKEQIKKYLTDKNKNEELRKLLTGLKNKAKIEFVDEEYDPEKIKEAIKEQMAKQKTKKSPKKEPAPEVEKSKELKK